MAMIPGGTFMMGSPEDERGREANEGPQHPVTIQSFAAGRFEVTFAEWDACLADGGCGGHRPNDRGWGRGNRPVMDVSWRDAVAYTEWLSRKTGKAYRLLTEAEWEYAARAGSTTRYAWGDDAGRGNANCIGCGSQWDGKQTAPAGSFKANAFGLHDMSGNLWEWVQDCWHADYRGNPRGVVVAVAPGACSSNVLRGGSWRSFPDEARSASRTWDSPGNRYARIGFRVARSLDR
jgi:formylglycine-generating enzyme required for sulfatase activity